MNFVDKKYISFISSSLDKFVWKKDTLANCRCPFCGDSDKNRSKARGYFFPFKERWVFKCHNCGISCGVHKVLQQVAPALAMEYSKESYAERISPNSTIESSTEKPKTPKRRKVNPLDGLPRLIDLHRDHPAVRYILGRGLPDSCLSELMYAQDFTKVGRNIDADYFQKDRKEDSRIVIPFFDRSGTFIGVQGRSLDPSNSLRYITLKAKGQEKLWYGLWKVDATQRVYIVEGPLDSMILPNCIAMVGASAADELPDFLQHSDVVYVLDNEPRNRHIVEYNSELIESGKQVCIWPTWISEKDINEMLASRNAESIRQVIDDHTYSNHMARLNLSQWRRI